MLARLRREWRAVLLSEAIFVAAFLIGCGVRMHSQGIKDAEKFMDMAFLTACIDAEAMPLQDPWRFEGAANYYYGGHLQMATPAKMWGTRPEVAYNLAMALVFALACQLAFALAFELCGRKRWAILGMCAVALMGNLDVVRQAHEYLTGRGSEGRFFVNEWATSRVIQDGPLEGEMFETINEFPAFSFLHSDLHAHVTAIPMVLLILLFVLNAFRTRGCGFGAFGSGWWCAWRFCALAGAVGSLALINGFDFLTFCAFTPLYLTAREWFASRGWRDPLRFMQRSAQVCVALILLAVLSHGLFFKHYQPPSVARANQEFVGGEEERPARGFPFATTQFRSDAGEYALAWGTQGAALLALALLFLRRVDRRCDGAYRGLAWYGAAGAWVALVALSGLTVVATLLWLLGILAWRCAAMRKSPRALFFHASAALALMTLIGCEKFHFIDGLGEGYERLNTLFKFFYPCWVILGACFPAALMWSAREVSGWRRKALVLALPLSLFAGAMAFPTLAALQRVRLYNASYEGTPDLDGMKYMRRDMAGDYEAILFLMQMGKPGEVVMEAVGGGYSMHSRIATHTPLRSVLGWTNHQSIWRGAWPTEIENDVSVAFNLSDYEAIKPILRKYRVRYVCVGPLERETYAVEGLAKFAKNLPIAFRSKDGKTTLYLVEPE